MKHDLFEATPEAFVAWARVIAAMFACTLVAIWCGWLA